MPERRFLDKQKPANKRHESRFDLRRYILIVCEGEKTEPNYFRSFPLAPHSVVEVVGSGENTLSLVRTALEYRKQHPYDQVWCVFDRDTFPVNNFNSALELARKNDIQVAYSNEAFELWYILHFHYLDTGITRQDYCDLLGEKQYLGRTYNKNSKTIFAELKNRQETAIRNAERLLTQYNPPNPAYDKPSTTVHLLVKELQNLRQPFWEDENSDRGKNGPPRNRKRL